jgi:hypothetical protein
MPATVARRNRAVRRTERSGDSLAMAPWRCRVLLSVPGSGAVRSLLDVGDRSPAHLEHDVIRPRPGSGGTWRTRLEQERRREQAVDATGVDATAEGPRLPARETERGSSHW